FRRSPSCAGLSRPLHSSRGHHQPPPRGLRRRPGYLSLEGLCSRQSEAEDDTVRARVLAPFPPPCSAARLRSHPFLRVLGHSSCSQPSPSLSEFAPGQPKAPCTCSNQFRSRAARLLPLSEMCHPDGPCRQTLGIDDMAIRSQEPTPWLFLTDYPFHSPRHELPL